MTPLPGLWDVPPWPHRVSRALVSSPAGPISCYQKTCVSAGPPMWYQEGALGGGNKVVPLLAKGQIYVLVQSPAKPALTAVLARGCILACRCTVAVTSLTTGRGTKAHPCSQVLCSQEPHPLLTQKHAACGSGPSSHAVASCVCGARRSELETTAHNVQAAGHHQNGTRPHSHARILNGWEHSNQGNSEPEQR